jgi:hypothetical protein
MANFQESVCIGAAVLFALCGLAGCSKSSGPTTASSSAPANPAPAATAKANGNIDARSLLTQQDAEEIAGKGATLTTNASECTIVAANKIERYGATIANVGANVEGAKKGALMALQNARPVPGIGDEAYADSHGLVVLKGQLMIIITGVSTEMSRVPEAEKKLALKLIAKL